VSDDEKVVRARVGYWCKGRCCETTDPLSVMMDPIKLLYIYSTH
jgi:hypothetical protein